VKFKVILKIILSLIVLALAYGLGYLYLNPQFGGRLSHEEKSRFSESPQWNGKVFENATETVMDINLSTMPGLLKEQFSDRAARAPKEKLPIAQFDGKVWQADTNPFSFIWFGHSVGLMKMAGLNLLIDPMFGPDASPIGPFRTKRYSDSTLRIINELPELDAVLITHDHYDHLDYDSFQLLKGKVKHYYVPLGVKRHLLRWDIPSEMITEFDWWDNAKLGDIEMTFVPARHFSGRGPFDRAESLWGGWTFVSNTHRVYWTGDGGYGEHFKEIGEKLGPFDWAFVECGQYNKLWHAIHMYPEESVQAAIDMKAKTAIPIHWGAFTLALHDWKNPVERFKEEALAKNQNIYMPEMGVPIAFADEQGREYWWEKYE
tara:strand:+ start:15867 stop:16988 length:1122 start_codon:yes stop_codon:yes gene_type:complete